jgi:hypothetical protein
MAPLGPELVAADVAAINGVALGAGRRCANIEAVSVESAMVLPVACGQVLGRLTHVEIRVMAELLIAVSRAGTSSLHADRTDPLLRANAIAT